MERCVNHVRRAQSCRAIIPTVNHVILDIILMKELVTVILVMQDSSLLKGQAITVMSVRRGHFLTKRQVHVRIVTEEISQTLQGLPAANVVRLESSAALKEQHNANVARRGNFQRSKEQPIALLVQRDNSLIERVEVSVCRALKGNTLI